MHLVAGLLLACAEGAGRAGSGPAWLAALRPVWIHLVAVGWLTQIVFGVALWMFPRAPSGRALPEAAVLAAWAALNGGLVARAVSEPAWTLGAGPGWGALLLASGVVQAAAVAVFAAALWPRVRGR